MKFEITDKRLAGQPIRIGNSEYNVDTKGFVEIDVEEDIYRAMNGGFDWIYPEGKVPTIEDKAKEIDVNDKEKIEAIFIDNNRLKDEIKKQKLEIKQLESEVVNWKKEYEKAVNGVTETDKIETDVETNDEADDDPIKALEAMEFESLKELYKQQGGTLQGIKTKEQLIKKIVEIGEK